MIVKLAEENLKTKLGEYHKIMYYDVQTESFALVMGDLKCINNDVSSKPNKNHCSNKRNV